MDICRQSIGQTDFQMVSKDPNNKVGERSNSNVWIYIPIDVSTREGQ